MGIKAIDHWVISRAILQRTAEFLPAARLHDPHGRSDRGRPDLATIRINDAQEDQPSMDPGAGRRGYLGARQPTPGAPTSCLEWRARSTTFSRC